MIRDSINREFNVSASSFSISEHRVLNLSDSCMEINIASHLVDFNVYFLRSLDNMYYKKRLFN